MRHVKENKNSNYNKDFYSWALTQANLLKNKEFEKIDLRNLVEEIEDLGSSQRSALESQMTRLLMHILKIEYQPKKHTKSWDRSVGDARIKIEKIIRKNPSLKLELKDVLNDSYYYARKTAHNETGIDIKKFPEICPWSLKEVLGE